MFLNPGLPGRLASLALALCLTAALGAPATAQVAPERVPAAEAAFQNGLASFRAGDYAEAYRLFRRAAGEFGANRTTAAT